MSWQFIGSPTSARTLAAASIALSFLGFASAFGFFAFGGLADAFACWSLGSPDFASSVLGSAGFPSSGASLAALLFLAFGAVLLFFALMMHLRNDVSMGLAAIVRRREPPVATPPLSVSACAERMHQLPRGREDIKRITSRIV